MHLAKLDINNVRNLSDVTLNCCPAINLLTGKNAAGKSAILESIHLLSWVSSFRTHRIMDVIQHGKERLQVTAQIFNENKRILSGLEKSREQTQIRYNGKKIIKRSEQARNLPVITITTESPGLLYGSPKERRHWLDWSLFHVEHDYMRDWQRYHHALRQRNALLRLCASPIEFSVWEEEMANASEAIWLKRNRYIEHANTALCPLVKPTIGEVSVRLKSQYETAEKHREKLETQRKTDMAAGHTQQGAHREDVIFEVKGKEAGKILSRGEGKQFVMFLLLVHAGLHKTSTGQQPILLIDDLPAELDLEVRNNLLNIIENSGNQVFITSTSGELLNQLKTDACLFHVEHGKIVEVVEYAA